MPRDSSWKIGDGLRIGQQLVRRPVVSGSVSRSNRHGRIERADVVHGAVEDGQRGQAQEVELHQADGLHVVLVVLRHHAGVAALGVQRAEVGQLARRDQHAAGVHADVAGDALDLLGEVEQLLDFFLVLRRSLSIGSSSIASAIETGLPGLNGNQLRDAVAEVVAEVEHAADVADRALGRHGTEGGDLRDRVAAVQVLHVLDDEFALFLAEVDVEVGHRDAFRDSGSARTAGCTSADRGR
jgi:hypothetical protein